MSHFHWRLQMNIQWQHLAALHCLWLLANWSVPTKKWISWHEAPPVVLAAKHLAGELCPENICLRPSFLHLVSKTFLALLIASCVLLEWVIHVGPWKAAQLFHHFKPLSFSTVHFMSGLVQSRSADSSDHDAIHWMLGDDGICSATTQRVCRINNSRASLL